MANEHNKLTGLPALTNIGVEASSPLQLVYYKRDPQPHDKKNYLIGCWWINTSNNNVWALVSLERNTATWLQFTTSFGMLLQITTATGNTVPDFGRTIYLPNGTLITTSSPGASTVEFDISNGNDGQLIIGQGANPPVWGNLTSQNATITITPDLTGPGTINLDTTNPQATITYHTQAGDAQEVGDIVNVRGAGGIRTTGAGNTISLGLTVPRIPTTFHTQGGNALPAANILNVVGGNGIATSGAGNSITVGLNGGTLQGRITTNCAFLAYLNATIPLAAGNNAFRPLPANTVLFDKGGDYNPHTLKFTAPVGGYYYFVYSILFNGIPTYTAFAQPALRFASETVPLTSYSTGTGVLFRAIPNIVINPAYGSSLCGAGSWYWQLSAGDTFQITYAYWENNTYTVPPISVPDINVYGAPSDHLYTYFGGYLVYEN